MFKTQVKVLLEFPKVLPQKMMSKPMRDRGGELRNGNISIYKGIDKNKNKSKNTKKDMKMNVDINLNVYASRNIIGNID